MAHCLDITLGSRISNVEMIRSHISYMLLIRLGHNGVTSVLIIVGFRISGYKGESMASSHVNVSLFGRNVTNRLFFTLVSCRSIDQLVINRSVLLILRDTGT